MTLAFNPSRDRRGVSPVIGTVLMVAMTVILATAVFILVLPMMNPDVDPDEPQLILVQDSVTQNGPNDWDTSFTIMAVKADDAIDWNTVSFVIQEPTGSIITDATITYTDGDGDGNLEEGDSIIITGMTDPYDGATLKVLHRGQLLTVIAISFTA